MNKTEFNFVIINIFGIADQVFARQCGSFLETIAEDGNAAFSVQAAGLEDFQGDVNYQFIIDQGYRSVESLTSEFSAAWAKVNASFLEQVLTVLPTHLPNLIRKINGEELKIWVDYVVDLPEENDFNRAHQYCQGLFHSGGQGNDIIREAIADDNVNLLVDNEKNISLDAITFEDINTALMIESVKTFEWLAVRASLTDEQVLGMLEYVVSDLPYFERVYATLTPSAHVRAALETKVVAMGEAGVLAFLQQK